MTGRIRCVGCWPAERASRLRQAAADAVDGWPWLEPPASLGTPTVVDVAAADPADRVPLVRVWVDAAWAARRDTHDSVRTRAAGVVAVAERGRPADRRRRA